MALDGALLSLITEEVKLQALGCRIEKITMPFKDRIVLFLSKTGFKAQLLLCANPTSPRIHFTSKKYENPPTPPMLCMLLRKRLVSGRLEGIRQVGIDRIIFLDFLCKNELGDDITLSLCVEIMGSLSNIILLENGKIVDCVRRFDPEEGKRFMLPGAVYELPENTKRLNLFETDTSTVSEQLDKYGDKPITKALSSTLDGLSPLIHREIAFLSVGDFDKPINELNAYQRSKLFDTLEQVKQLYNVGGTPLLIKDENGAPKDFTFMPISQYGECYSAQQEQSYSELLEQFYGKRDAAERMKHISAAVTKTVSNLITRTTRKIAARQKELEATKNKEYLREYGELIKANLHLIKSGDTFVDCVNYYDPECKTVRIRLDESLPPFKNAQKYFRDYRKKTTAAGMLTELIEKAQNDLSYYESVYDEIRRAKTPSELEAIKDELISQGLVKTKTKKPRKPQKQKPMSVVSPDGFEIYIGRNNVENDWLTTKFAQKNDIWFHTKNIPGSHIIVVSRGEVIPETTLSIAATLAATNSKAFASRQVPVDYTPVRFVKKPNGAKPGMVIYKQNQTAFVDPDEALFERLKGDAK